MGDATTHAASSATTVSSLREVMARLDALAPGAPLVAFGQTPLWDEPMKAILAAGANRPLIVGIHDLDYFSRVRAILPGGRWQIIARDDGPARDAWIAAGELSVPFGAEYWPGQQALLRAGVRLDRLLPRGEKNPAALARVTAGWGWRGIVENTLTPSVISDLAARDLAPTLRELLQWGFNETAHLLSGCPARRPARALHQDLAETLDAFLAEQPAASVADLYRALMRRVYERLLGGVPENVTFSGTRELLTFNRRTARLPRFRFIEHFLHPRRAAVAREAYDAATEGAGMVRLAEVGPHALPIELYVPNRGRGTIHLAPDRLRIETDPPIEIPLARPVQCLERLAEVVEDSLGPQTALLGKALVLPAMLNGEFIMTLTETGSVYLPRTRQMIERMRAGGLPVRVHPVLRVRLRTWDSLAAFEGRFHLPDHLAQAFGKAEVTGAEFATGWRPAVRAQYRCLRQIKTVGSPCEMVRFLGHDEHDEWFARLERCQRAHRALLTIQRRADTLRHRALALRAHEDEVAAEVATLERERGTFNRTTLRPLKRALLELPDDAPQSERERLHAEHQRAEKRGAALLLALETKQAERRSWVEKRCEVTAKLRAVERGGAANRARRIVREVETAAEKARLRLARNALLTAEGLVNADRRPSAWWMPAVDPSGKWFRQIGRSARYRVEELYGEDANAARLRKA